MNQTLQTDRKISKMFKLLKDDLLFCKLCQRQVELVESAQIEFWRHQTESTHLELLIDFWLQETEKQKQQNKKPQQKEPQNEEIKSSQPHKKYLDFQKVKRIQKEEKICEKVTSQNNVEKEEDELVIAIEVDGKAEQIKQQQQKKEELIISDSSCESGLMKVKAADFKSLADWNQKKLRIEEKKRSDANEFSFQDLVQKYFLYFIQQLMANQCYLEVICFILAKTGKVARDLCTLRFDDLPKEYIMISQSNLLSEQLLNILKEAASFLQSQGKVQSGYFMKSTTQPKDDKLYKKFLMRVQIRALNKLVKNTNSNQESLQNSEYSKMEQGDDELSDDQEEQIKKGKQRFQIQQLYSHEMPEFYQFEQNQFTQAPLIQQNQLYYSKNSKNHLSQQYSKYD